MSSDSLALFRKSMGDDLGKMAEHHYREYVRQCFSTPQTARVPKLTTHSLQQTDRDTLKTAARKVSTYTTAGSLIGLGLGIFLAYKLRTNRTAMFQAFRASEKPTHVQFAGGRTGESPSPSSIPTLW